MSEKRETRIVPWTSYLRIAGKGIALKFSCATLVGIAGVSSLLSCLLLFICLSAWISWRDKPWDEDMIDLVRGAGWFGTVFGIGGLTSLFGAVKTWQGAKKVEPVALLTKHNTGQLPEVKTLIRASDVPPLHQQAELLRAAQHGNETPAEELLRATATTRQDA
jgi:hypothetical protein